MMNCSWVGKNIGKTVIPSANYQDVPDISRPECKIYLTKKGREKTIAINGLNVST